MEVSFVKRAGGYDVRITRDKPPVLAPRRGPGGRSRIPHDAAHMVVEIEASLSGGVFGRLYDANGLDGLFWPADPAERRKAARRPRRPTAGQVEDMERSEYLASLTFALWEVERGFAAPDPAWPGRTEDADVKPELLQRIFDRFDDFDARWRELSDGGEVTVAWVQPRTAVRGRLRPAR
ncbi:hypothetical protein [Gordonia sp. ABSL49_1]|uniref:hypothetical protein n=1 Tax=Gordonia sp. ABSL49_1 TaxID=2920941 RepID=UPI001F0FD4FF|nr:hypothetical protein [Gordonia sp. ABSL49_1]MCH5641834.1 hypothetical protein [Gordonia sp. ABSL49_1]